MKPTIGRTVHVLVDPKQNNGSDVAPAVITRVWSEQPGGAVNLRVQHDGPSVAPEGRQDWLTSVPLYESREALEADHAARWGHLEHPVPAFGAFWPAIVREPGDRPASTVSTTSFRPDH